MTAERWLVEWFARRESGFDSDTADVRADYFDQGWLDSLGLLELIEAAESNFHIRFSAANFEDRRFRSISGLAALIDELTLLR